MVSKRLLGLWAFIDFTLLVCGVVAVVLSIVWRAPSVLMNMLFTSAYLNAGLALGIALLATVALSIFAIIQANHITIGLVILNWVLIADALIITVIGTFVWYFTLQERNNVHALYAGLDSAGRIAIQDQLSCCGYFNDTDLVEIGGNFCQNTTFVQGANNASGNFCVTPLTAWTDYSMSNVFTTVYGFMAVVICLFLTTVCVIKKRQEHERFKKIDAKRGRGFV
jgi:hypothetical protein